MKRPVWAAALALGATACTCGPLEPTDVRLGDTALIVVVNPTVNAANTTNMIPPPGPERANVPVTLSGSPGASSNSAGVAVLTYLDAGTFTMGVGSQSQSLALISRQVREMAISTTPASGGTMVDVRHALNLLSPVTIDAGMTPAQIASVLNTANTVVMIQGGTYPGNLALTASNVTIFGESANGGPVTINGDVTVNGANNHIRGARINGSLRVVGNDFGLTFSRVRDAVNVSGSGVVFLQNSLCDGGVFTGPAATVVGNAGLAPLDGGC